MLLNPPLLQFSAIHTFYLLCLGKCTYISISFCLHVDIEQILSTVDATTFSELIHKIIPRYCIAGNFACAEFCGVASQPLQKKFHLCSNDTTPTSSP